MGKTFLDAVRQKYQETADDVAADDDLVVSAEGQREEKKWIMVGMDKLKRKTGQLERLVSVAVGEEGVQEAGDTGALPGALPSLRQLELAKADSFEGWSLPCELLQALPSITDLDLSCTSLYPDADPSGDAVPQGSLSHLEKLVLNKTSTSWQRLAAVAEKGVFANLTHLYSEGNAIGEVGAPFPAPKLRYLSLRDNAISSWEGVCAVLKGSAEGRSSVEELVLSSNALPDPSDACVDVLSSSGLVSLAVSENKTGSLGWLKRLGASPTLTSLKVTYPAIEGIAPNHVRLLVIADMPRLTSLNASTVTAKERGEAEKFYILNAFASLPKGTEHKDDCSDLPQEFCERYPHYKGYVEKWSNPSTAQTAAPASGMSGIAELTLRDCIQGRKFKPDVTRPLPVIMKVAQLKAVVKAAFQIDVPKQVLVYKSLEYDIPVPTPLDRDLEPLTYFGITGGKGVVEVSEA
eukprot:TRINITY_DN2010_c3_g3_i3.p2 TRINITY_DN2010_c3_g3~~TRINITY_DN2010_c3_g3_i3.p2  ORF type:complete len:463 (+),score=169.87 TRINITY_DN2010_c3_g3_i3:66-1454(+)